MIKNSINNTVTNVASYINEISNVLSAMSRDDLEQSITREYVGKFSDIKGALNNIIDKFNAIIYDIYSAAEQASSVEELNATVLTINEATKNNAGNAEEAKKLASASKNNAEAGNLDMKNMLASMDGINDSSNNIAKIIKVIDVIDFQTNLLAHNATVEAARVGSVWQGWERSSGRSA